jgi:hypothetical protein
LEVELSTEPALVLRFADQRRFAEFIEEARAEAGFLVVLEKPLKLFERIPLRLVFGSQTRLEAEIEVAQVFRNTDGSFQTAFLVAPDLFAREKIQGSSGEMDGVSPMFQIKEMNVSQKARMAMRANRSERQILLRDNSPQVLQGLLVNPRIEAKEILRLVKSTHANAAILQRVAGDPRWGKNREILAAVVKNPKTATPLATRLMEKLRTSDLRLLAKMSTGYKESVRRAALSEYLKRSAR